MKVVLSVWIQYRECQFEFNHVKSMSHLCSQFSPMTGPIQGRTNISVTGLNLGKTYTDLEVTVAGVECIVQPYEYESSQR